MENNTKKIYIKDDIDYVYKHRSGWPFAISLLKELNSNNGILFDSFIEKTFAWGNNSQKSIIYKEPWIGIFHVPNNIPEWFNKNQAPSEIFKNKYFKESLKQCKGFYCLSEYEKNILKNYTNLPINVIFHPTETPEIKFSIDEYINNENKEIIQLGTFLRKLSSIFILPVKKIKKSAIGIDTYNFIQLKKEAIKLNLKINKNDVKIYNFLKNDDYDLILSKNITFMDLYDSSANNAIIECIVRNTPLLINPHPAVIEYLGVNYPFYFNSLEEAAIKAENIDLIRETNEYLKNLKIKENLRSDIFIKSIIYSDIYKNIEIKPLSKCKKIKRIFTKNILLPIIFIKKIIYKIKKFIISTNPNLYFKIKKIIY